LARVVSSPRSMAIWETWTRCLTSTGAITPTADSAYTSRCRSRVACRPARLLQRW
jgi:hypothetical protein